MEIGISTASLFRRQFNEDALVTLNQIDSRVTEIFLGAFCEYKKDFAMLLNERKGSLKVHSIHTLNTHFEPELFSLSTRAKADAIEILGDVLNTAEILGAKNYTFHGKCAFKKGVKFNDVREIANNFSQICDLAEKKGVNICLENVEWAFYREVGFFSKIKEIEPRLMSTLDIKQARISGYSYIDYLNEMASSLQTVHLSDINSQGKICLPGKGRFDFKELFLRLRDIGFNGNMLIEVYYSDYNSISELCESMNYLRDLKELIFK